MSKVYECWVPESAEVKAKTIRQEEDRIPGIQRFDSDKRWVGKIGEWAVMKLFPSFLPETQHYKAVKFDFRHFLTGEKMEVKTVSGNYNFSPKFSGIVNASQFSENGADIYIFCYYELGMEYPRNLRVVGWISGDDFYERAVFRQKGEDVLGVNGVVMFQASAPLYQINYGYLWNMDSLMSKTQV